MGVASKTHSLACCHLLSSKSISWYCNGSMSGMCQKGTYKLWINQYISIVNPLKTHIQAQPQTKAPLAPVAPDNYEPHTKAFSNYCLVSKIVDKNFIIVCNYTVLLLQEKTVRTPHTRHKHRMLGALRDTKWVHITTVYTTTSRVYSYSNSLEAIRKQKNLNPQFNLVWCYIWSKISEAFFCMKVEFPLHIINEQPGYEANYTMAGLYSS